MATATETPVAQGAEGTPSSISAGSPAPQPSAAAPSPAGSEPQQTAPSPATETQPEGTEPAREGTAAPAETLDYRRWAESASPEEILAHRRIAGIVGQKAQEQAAVQLASMRAQLAEEIRQEQADRAEDERLQQLRSIDPGAYLEERERVDSERKTRASAAQLATQRDSALVSGAHQRMQLGVKQLQDKLPAEIQREVASRSWPGTVEEGFSAYLNEVVRLSVEHGVNSAKAGWEKVERPALRKQLLAELNGGEPRPDTGGGRGGPGGMTQEEFDANRHDQAWVISNIERLQQAVTDNRVRR